MLDIAIPAEILRLFFSERLSHGHPASKGKRP
jgi:hypothetical protein